MLQVLPIVGLPEVQKGDCLAGLLLAGLADMGSSLRVGDIIVVAQKIVSKAEGRWADLDRVMVSARAHVIARQTGKDPALVELVLQESSDVVRAAPHVLITRHRLGHVMANAGIDASNAGSLGDRTVLLLPEDPDSSAAHIAARMEALGGGRPAILISDSFGRPWRMGTTNVAIGVSGMPALIDRRGERDRDGRVLQMTQAAFADAVAAAAGLVLGEGAEGVPAALVRGLTWQAPAQTSEALLRPLGEDLFR